MDDKNEIKEKLENEYKDLFDRFIKSDDEACFTKNEVKKIIEAYIYKEIMSQATPVEPKKKKNLLVTSKAIGVKLFNKHFLLSFLLSYVFYIGFLLLIKQVFYPNLFLNKPSVFIIGFLFTIIDKLIKPFVFVFDLISFTFHKIGLISLVIYTVTFYFASYLLHETISVGQALLISVVVLLCIALIDFLKRDSFIKARYLADDFPPNRSDHDE